MRLPAFVEVVPSQHGLSDQMEEAAKEWFSVDPQDKVNYDVNIMTAQGPLGMFAGSPRASQFTQLSCSNKMKLCSAQLSLVVQHTKHARCVQIWHSM